MALHFTSISMAPGWWGVFTTDAGQPVHVPVGGFATVQYLDEDVGEAFSAIEVVFADGPGLTTVYCHDSDQISPERLVGIFGPGQYEKITEADWNVRCLARLEEVKSEHDNHVCSEHGNESGGEPDTDPKSKRHLRSVN